MLRRVRQSCRPAFPPPPACTSAYPLKQHPIPVFLERINFVLAMGLALGGQPLCSTTPGLCGAMGWQRTLV